MVPEKWPSSQRSWHHHGLRRTVSRCSGHTRWDPIVELSSRRLCGCPVILAAGVQAIDTDDIPPDEDSSPLPWILSFSQLSVGRNMPGDADWSCKAELLHSAAIPEECAHHSPPFSYKFFPFRLFRLKVMWKTHLSFVNSLSTAFPLPTIWEHDRWKRNNEQPEKQQLQGGMGISIILLTLLRLLPLGFFQKIWKIAMGCSSTVLEHLVLV